MTFGYNLFMTLVPNGDTKRFELIDEHFYFVFVITRSGVADVFILVTRKDLVDHAG